MIGALNIGQLDRRVVVQQVSATQDAVTGEWKESWSTYTTLWMGKMSKAGKEKLQANQVITVGDEVFICRYDSGITEAMRLSWNSNTYEITSVTEIGREAGLQLIAQRLN